MAYQDPNWKVFLFTKVTNMTLTVVGWSLVFSTYQSSHYCQYTALRRGVTSKIKATKS